ncbi:uncharacterized protein LOC126313322 [Schistocerca gregaria]|uniref:uncharacterized protein LOC126313322 n=1 Tax=Schistocerca gregaria TaxID=7010 RepID=UPI00211E279F|nr:uncharacterized protein LOC126313322 [Schistocerca gregaria]
MGKKLDGYWRTMNPASKYRKKMKAKEMKKNKEKREQERAAILSRKSEAVLRAELEIVEKAEREGRADGKMLQKRRQIRDILTKLEKEKSEKEKDTVKAPLSHQELSNMYPDAKGSIYYHPITNPYGVPPPGMPQVWKEDYIPVAQRSKLPADHPLYSENVHEDVENECESPTCDSEQDDISSESSLDSIPPPPDEPDSDEGNCPSPPPLEEQVENAAMYPETALKPNAHLILPPSLSPGEQQNSMHASPSNIHRDSPGIVDPSSLVANGQMQGYFVPPYMTLPPAQIQNYHSMAPPMSIPWGPSPLPLPPDNMNGFLYPPMPCHLPANMMLPFNVTPDDSQNLSPHFLRQPNAEAPMYLSDGRDSSRRNEPFGNRMDPLLSLSNSHRASAEAPIGNNSPCYELAAAKDQKESPSPDAPRNRTPDMASEGSMHPVLVPSSVRIKRNATTQRFSTPRAPVVKPSDTSDAKTAKSDEEYDKLIQELNPAAVSSSIG